MLAPNAKLRALVVPQGPSQPEQAAEAAATAECEREPVQVRPHRITWARLLKCVFDIDMHAQTAAAAAASSRSSRRSWNGR